ncbi:MAG: hypothetical protein HFE78_02105 [Clostridiales bacterium]|nr:hypothetical protein [Clostridiales bacterium]
MKKLFSAMLAILMVMITAAGSFMVMATAEGNPAIVTVIAGDVRSDGTFDVAIYVKDQTSYGFTDFGIQLDWNTAKIEPVTKQVNDRPVAFCMSDLYRFVTSSQNSKDVYISSKMNTEKQSGAIKEAYVFSTAAGSSCKIAFGSNDFGFGFNKAAVDQSAANVTYHETYGLLFASATFRAKAGASGLASISASVYSALRADDDTSTPAYTNVKDLCVSGQTEVDIGDGEVGQALLSVKPGASIRYVSPVGLRFTCSITAEDFSAISEFGTEIKRGNDALKIPAEVYISGDPEEGGEVVYTGVLSHLMKNHYTTNFTARAYAVINGVTVYSDSSFTANAKDTAKAVLEDEELVIDPSLYEQAMAVLNNIANS